MSTQRKMAEQHAETKHKKNKFEECFPMCVEADEEEKKDEYDEYEF